MKSMIVAVGLFLMMPVLAMAKGTAAPAEVLSAYATSSGQTIYTSNAEPQDVPLDSQIRSFYFRLVNHDRVGTSGAPTITAIRFIGPQGVIPMKLPRMIQTKVEASSVLGPFTAYQPANL